MALTTHIPEAERIWLYYYSRRQASKVRRLLKIIGEDVLKLSSIYCELVRLDRADGINLDELLDEDVQEFVEKLLKTYNIQCEVPF